MKKLRWAMDGGFWEVDVSTPLTVDGVARPVPGDILPLGLSRGPRLSRPKQIDFFQRFMAMPFVPSFSDGLSLQRLQSFPLPSFARENWFLALIGQFNVQKFVTSLRRNGLKQMSDASSLQTIWKQLSDPNLYALNFCSELWLTPEDTLLLSVEAQGDDSTRRKKAIFQHKFPHHNLNIEATTPALFVDHLGKYWNVPFTLVMDLASVASDTGTSCHFCINHAAGSPKLHKNLETSSVPPTLIPDLWAKFAVSFKKNFDIWRSEAPKRRNVQPYDIFLSSPHLSASTILGTVVTGSVTNDSLKSVDPNGFQIKGANTVLLADFFATASLSAQLGNFQRRFLDLTRINIQFDTPSGSKFIVGASQMANDLLNSQVPTTDTIQAICPSASLSFQQQIAGPFSFRVDAGVILDLNKERYFRVKDPVCAVEYALKVLGSAKAVAWYSLKQREFMIELRFFET